MRELCSSGLHVKSTITNTISISCLKTCVEGLDCKVASMWIWTVRLPEGGAGRGDRRGGRLAVAWVTKIDVGDRLSGLQDSLASQRDSIPGRNVCRPGRHFVGLDDNCVGPEDSFVGLDDAFAGPDVL